jgi:histidine triad (HIT) family protein
MTAKPDCVFCAIIGGQGATKSIFETETVAVIKPKTERNPGHVLVIPKKHYKDITDVDAAVLKDMILAAQQETDNQ